MTFSPPTCHRASIRRVPRGFTLIELLVVVAVIGILSAIAIPSYSEFVARGRRADAKTQLLSAQQWMERLYSESYDYRNDAAGTAVSVLWANQAFSTSPRAGEGPSAYTLSVAASASTYTLTATRTLRAQGDKCGDFTLDHTGLKSLINYNTSQYSTLLLAIQDCWR